MRLSEHGEMISGYHVERQPFSREPTPSERRVAGRYLIRRSLFRAEEHRRNRKRRRSVASYGAHVVSVNMQEATEMFVVEIVR